MRTRIKSFKLENVANTYSAFNSIKFDNDDEHEKCLLYCQFVAWYCKCSSIVPLIYYGNKEIQKQFPRLEEVFTNSHEKPFIDLRRSKGYTHELEKLSEDDSILTLTVTLKHEAT